MSDVVSTYSFWVDELPMTRNSADRKHWSALANEKKRWLFLVRHYAGNVRAAEPCDLIVTFRTTRKNDLDNLAARCKSPLDAMQRAGIITNDNPDTITLSVRQEIVKTRAEQGTLIEWRERLPFDEPLELVNEAYE